MKQAETLVKFFSIRTSISPENDRGDPQALKNMLWEPQKKPLLTSWDTLVQSDQYIVVYRILKWISTVFLMLCPRTTSPFLDGSLPNCLLERLIMPTGAVRSQKSSKQTIPAFSGHSLSVLSALSQRRKPPHTDLSDSHFFNHKSAVILLFITLHYWSLSDTQTL